MELECLEPVGGENTEKDLVLFALSTCGWCRKARGFLDENDFAYRYVYLDKLEGKEQQDVLSVASRFNPKKTFPLLVIDNGDALIGFDANAYREKLL